MTTAKARYVGDGAGKKPKDFSEALKRDLRAYYPQENAVSYPEFAHSADTFVDEILSKARRAVSDLMDHELDLTKAEIIAEHEDLRITLVRARDKLQMLSPDYSKLLEISTDPLGTADQLSRLIESLDGMEYTFDQLPTKQKVSGIHHDIALEMAITVLRVAVQHGLKVAATYDVSFGYASVAIKILKAIGDDIGLRFDGVTWKAIVIEAKKQAPDIR